MTSTNREGILWLAYMRNASVGSQATACYLLHTGLCPQQHTDRQSAHCLPLGSVIADAVSLILHSWRLKRGKNHQKSFLASPDITSAANISWKKRPTLCLHKVPLSSVTLKLQFRPALACQMVPTLQMWQKLAKRFRESSVYMFQDVK